LPPSLVHSLDSGRKRLRAGKLGGKPSHSGLRSSLFVRCFFGESQISLFWRSRYDSGSRTRPNGKHLPRWAEHLLTAAIVALATWILSSAQAAAVQEQRLHTIEEDVKAKASNEKVDELKREVLSRLDRIENKIDRNDRRVK
jgi:hypothetical protein